MINKKEQHFTEWGPFNFSKKEKDENLNKQLKELTYFHYKNCVEYKRLLNYRNIDMESIMNITEIPWIPVSLFKYYELKSIPKDQIYKVLYSSGTTGQNLSKIFLNKETSLLQSKILVKIIQNFLGKKRLPMLIIDNPNTISSRDSFSARSAGILGLSNFGHSHTYALQDDMSLNTEKILEFSEKYNDQPKLIFGFTFMIWKYFIKQLEKEKNSLNLANSTLFHSGGWKKLEKEAVHKNIFKKKVEDLTGVNKIFNFYGMVEQVGSIFVECEYGHLHAPSFADILIRDPKNFDILKNNSIGLVQVLSLLPLSYPGHSILTEDIGKIIGEDDCKCGRKGKYFEIYGRIKNSETRGCSDTFKNE